jgi:hypothetical protein
MALAGLGTYGLVSFLRALAVVLGGVIIASLVLAWRAARTNPLAALRHR